ncbi:MAG: hypothetical protein GY777_07825 [Candidatus Brocadiaceae bacterium]|nr:hypothetical protein [Candidatus Brocadiaceae bacterium]
MTKNKYWNISLPILLVGLSIIVRCLVYWHLKDHRFGQNISYYDVLRNHLWEFLFFDTTRPPLMYLLQTIPVWIFSNDSIAALHPFLVMTFIMDVLAVLLIYYSAKNLHINSVISFVITFFYSLALIPFELWRYGTHYDHQTIFFTSLFMFTCTRLMRDNGLKNLVFVSISGTLLLLQSPANSLIVPILCLVVLFFSMRRAQFKVSTFIKKGSIILLLPIILNTGIVVKNFKVDGTLCTSSMGGLSKMNLLFRIHDSDPDQVQAFMESIQVPSWFLWCFEQPPDNVWWFKARGHCYQFEKLSSGHYVPQLISLYDHLIQTGNDTVAEIVNKDLLNAIERPYLFSGFNPEDLGAWQALYGRECTNIFWKYVSQHPLMYLEEVRSLYNGKWKRGGPEFVLMAVERFSNKFPLPAKSVFSMIAKIYENITYYAYKLLYIYIALLLGIVIVRLLIFKKQSLSCLSIPSFILLALPITTLSLIFCSITCCENDRYFMQITPYLILMVGYFISKFLGLVSYLFGLYTNNSTTLISPLKG